MDARKGVGSSGRCGSWRLNGWLSKSRSCRVVPKGESPTISQDSSVLWTSWIGPEGENRADYAHRGGGGSPRKGVQSDPSRQPIREDVGRKNRVGSSGSRACTEAGQDGLSTEGDAGFGVGAERA